ncbi:hypothetical protein E4T47_05277 [Aureobasidium subglaciale]|nr:hypothetical protein E4T47_05277 [Aureobasidium subglaciale]
MCQHENEGLKRALEEASHRWMASVEMQQIKHVDSDNTDLGTDSYHPRHWALRHAREWIMFTYNQMVDIRKQQYEAHLATIPYYELYKIYSGRPPISQPQMHELRMQMSAAQGAYQRGIDEDWKNKVLDYYFNLVDFKLPGEKSVAVLEPMFGRRIDPEMKWRESKGRRKTMMPPGGPLHMAGPGPGRIPPFMAGMRHGSF